MKWVSAKTPPHDNRVVLITYRHRTTRELMVGNAIYDCGHWLYVTGEVLAWMAMRPCTDPKIIGGAHG